MARPTPIGRLTGERGRPPRRSADRGARALLAALALGAVAAGCAPARSAESTGEPAVCEDVRRLADSAAPLLAGATVRQAVHDELRAVAAASPGEVATAATALEAQLVADPGTPVGDTTATTAPANATPPREVVTLWALDTCGLDPFQPRRQVATATTAATAVRRRTGVLDWPAVKDLVAAARPGAEWLARDTQGTVADDPDLGVTVVVFGSAGGEEALAVCRDVRAAVVAERPNGTAVQVRVRGPVGETGAATRPDGSCTTTDDGASG
ncbi:MAG: hypothetical protein U0Q07_17160 [Acidimicrobiales bacterium]